MEAYWLDGAYTSASSSYPLTPVKNRKSACPSEYRDTALPGGLGGKKKYEKRIISGLLVVSGWASEGIADINGAWVGAQPSEHRSGTCDVQ